VVCCRCIPRTSPPTCSFSGNHVLHLGAGHQPRIGSPGRRTRLQTRWSTRRSRWYLNDRLLRVFNGHPAGLALASCSRTPVAPLLVCWQGPSVAHPFHPLPLPETFPTPSTPHSGQRKPTRVVRILAEDTVEQCVLRLQGHKAQTTRQGHSYPHPSRPQQQQQQLDLALAMPPGGGGPSVGLAVAPRDDESGGGGEDPLLALEDLDGGTVLRFFDNL